MELLPYCFEGVFINDGRPSMFDTYRSQVPFTLTPPHKGAGVYFIRQYLVESRFCP